MGARELNWSQIVKFYMSPEYNMNLTIKQIFNEYRNELYRMMGFYNDYSVKFEDVGFAEKFQARFERITTLANLYADLLSQVGRKN
jgi:hypothetical protein